MLSRRKVDDPAGHDRFNRRAFPDHERIAPDELQKKIQEVIVITICCSFIIL